MIYSLIQENPFLNVIFYIFYTLLQLNDNMIQISLCIYSYICIDSHLKMSFSLYSTFMENVAFALLGRKNSFRTFGDLLCTRYQRIFFLRLGFHEMLLDQSQLLSRIDWKIYLLLFFHNKRYKN